MKIGLVYPQTEYPADPAAVRDYAQTAEGLGFSHILAYDHILGASLDHPNAANMPYTIRDPFHEPLSLFAFMSGITRRIEFTSGIVILPQRQTVLFAKQAASLDVLSTGRLRLGIGLGWNEIEFISLNENFHNRGRRIEEQVEVLRQLWTKPLVDFQGKWHNIPNAGLNPMPLQQPIPIWFGGRAEPALRRAARLGEGWMCTTQKASEVGKALDIINKTLEGEGRTFEGFGLEARLAYGSGDRDWWVDEAAAWQKAGATHLSFNTMKAGFTTPKEHLLAVQRFAEITGVNPE
jgi:probable F420-dependent oxidoreductase